MQRKSENGMKLKLRRELVLSNFDPTLVIHSMDILLTFND